MHDLILEFTLTHKALHCEVQWHVAAVEAVKTTCWSPTWLSERATMEDWTDIEGSEQWTLFGLNVSQIYWSFYTTQPSRPQNRKNLLSELQPLIAQAVQPQRGLPGWRSLKSCKDPNIWHPRSADWLTPLNTLHMWHNFMCEGWQSIFFFFFFNQLTEI